MGIISAITGSHPAGGGEYPEEALRILKGYIRQTEFKRMLNRIVTAQSDLGFRSVSVLSPCQGDGKTFFVSALALAYTCYLQSRVLIIETIRQTKNRSLYIDCILGEHGLNSTDGAGNEPGYIDLVTTECFEKGDFDHADFHIGSYIQRVGERYDLVLVDTCALESAGEELIDPVVVAKHTDTSIVLSSDNPRKRKHLDASLVKLEKDEVSLLGIVRNAQK